MQVTDRRPFLQALASDKTAIHVGFCGGELSQTRGPSGLWLHDLLRLSASRLIGIDIDPDGINAATALGLEAYVADCQDRNALRHLNVSGDIVFAPEIIEHLEVPGSFLDAMHELAPVLVITTPNSTSALSFFYALLGREVVNPHHVAIYSWYTLTNLLSRHGWRVSNFSLYQYPRADGDTRRGIVRRTSSAAVTHAIRAGAKMRPLVAHGLVAVCEEES